MMFSIRTTAFGLPLFCLTIALGMASTASAQSSKQTSSEPLPNSVSLDKIPADAKEIDEAMKTAKQGETIVLRGRIAMAKDAFVKGSAAFTLIDDAAAATCCPKDGKILDTCSAPAESKATIQLVDKQETLLPIDLEGKGGLKHGAEVFVVGKVASADGRNVLVVNAAGIHVPAAGIPMGFFVRQMPQDAKDLSEVKKAGGLKKGDKVVVRGVIGGSTQPFVDGRAMFTLMGKDLKPCNATPDDHCPTPWDYCCETRKDITANSATIRVADDKGNPLRTDLKGRLGIKELSDVVVVGTVAMAKNGALIVDASSMHVVRP